MGLKRSGEMRSDAARRGCEPRCSGVGRNPADRRSESGAGSDDGEQAVVEQVRAALLPDCAPSEALRPRHPGLPPVDT
jgi:hypothetical protein